jgi:hypothetical protein
MLLAASATDPDLVRECLNRINVRKMVDISPEEFFGDALKETCKHGRMDIIDLIYEYMNEHEIKINQTDLLRECASRNETKMVDIFIERGANPINAFHVFCQKSEMPGVRYLYNIINRGNNTADKDEDDPRQSDEKGVNLEDWLNQGLLGATMGRHHDSVVFLLDRIPDREIKYMQFFVTACKANDVRIANLALDKGKRVSDTTIMNLINHPGGSIDSIVIYSCEYGHCEILQFLIELIRIDPDPEILYESMSKLLRSCRYSAYAPNNIEMRKEDPCERVVDFIGAIRILLENGVHFPEDDAQHPFGNVSYFVINSLLNRGINIEVLQASSENVELDDMITGLVNLKNIQDTTIRTLFEPSEESENSYYKTKFHPLQQVFEYTGYPYAIQPREYNRIVPQIPAPNPNLFVPLPEERWESDEEKSENDEDE